MSRKGVFIPDITVEMFRNATLESVEEFMVSGQMEDIEISERPHGEWIQSDKDKYWAMCSVCKKEAIGGDFMILTDFCPNCGADMRTQNDRSWDTSERGVSGSVENSISQKEGEEKC